VAPRRGGRRSPGPAWSGVPRPCSRRRDSRTASRPPPRPRRGSRIPAAAHRGLPASASMSALPTLAGDDMQSSASAPNSAPAFHQERVCPPSQYVRELLRETTKPHSVACPRWPPTSLAGTCNVLEVPSRNLCHGRAQQHAARRLVSRSLAPLFHQSSNSVMPARPDGSLRVLWGGGRMPAASSSATVICGASLTRCSRSA
jgi:hypothetical protein